MQKLMIIALMALATPAFAQAPMQHGMPTPDPAQTPATKAFQAAMARMMTDMGQPLSGNVDHDFVAGMLPHHRGAIEMAQIELQYGQDPALKRLARTVIRSQNQEVAFMRHWQQKHPTAP